MTRPLSSKVMSLDRARFGKLVTAKADLEARVALADQAVKQFCRQYSLDNGFGVILSAEQVARDMEVNGG